jgi:hypothetical protein
MTNNTVAGSKLWTDPFPFSMDFKNLGFIFDVTSGIVTDTNADLALEVSADGENWYFTNDQDGDGIETSLSLVNGTACAYSNSSVNAIGIAPYVRAKITIGNSQTNGDATLRCKIVPQGK